MNNLPLPIHQSDYVKQVIPEAMKYLPIKMNTKESEVMLTAIALQESGMASRWQIIDVKDKSKKGPARGLHQFEQGTRASRGGVWGIYLHPASTPHLHGVCAKLGIEFTPEAVYKAIEESDVFSTICARLLLLTDPRALPKRGEQQAAWDYYNRNWRPGRPHPDKWPSNYSKAINAVYA